MGELIVVGVVAVHCSKAWLQELHLKLLYAPGGYSAVGQPFDQIHRHVQTGEDAGMCMTIGEAKDTLGTATQLYST